MRAEAKSSLELGASACMSSNHLCYQPSAFIGRDFIWCAILQHSSRRRRILAHMLMTGHIEPQAGTTFVLSRMSRPSLGSFGHAVNPEPYHITYI